VQNQPKPRLDWTDRVAVRAPAPDDELLDAELAGLDRKLEATDAERRRLVDLYQAGLVELPDLQRRATEVEHRRRDLAQRRDALTAQRHDLARDNQLRRRIRDLAHRVPGRDRHPRLRPETDPCSATSSRTST